MVQVHFQDFGFGVSALDLDGREDLFDLPVDSLACAKVKLPGQLLRDRAGPLAFAEGHQIHEHGLQDAGRHQTPVVEETVVLRGHDGLPHVIGHLVQRGQGPFLEEKLLDQLAVQRVDARGELRFVHLELGQTGQVPCDSPHVRGKQNQEQNARPTEHAPGVLSGRAPETAKKILPIVRLLHPFHCQVMNPLCCKLAPLTARCVLSPSTPFFCAGAARTEPLPAVSAHLPSLKCQPAVRSRLPCPFSVPFWPRLRMACAREPKTGSEAGPRQN